MSEPKRLEIAARRVKRGDQVFTARDGWVTVDHVDVYEISRSNAPVLVEVSLTVRVANLDSGYEITTPADELLKVQTTRRIKP